MRPSAFAAVDLLKRARRSASSIIARSIACRSVAELDEIWLAAASPLAAGEGLSGVAGAGATVSEMIRCNQAAVAQDGGTLECIPQLAHGGLR